MDLIYEWIYNLSSFHQGILGTAVFTATSWLAQAAYKKSKSSGSTFKKAYSKLDVHKHVLHKEYIQSGNMQYASFGASIALLFAARWVILGVLILILFFGIRSIIDGNWLYVAAAWFSFNCMLEARSWLKDSSDIKNISHVPEEMTAEIYDALKPKEINQTPDNESS